MLRSLTLPVPYRRVSQCCLVHICRETAHYLADKVKSLVTECSYRSQNRKVKREYETDENNETPGRIPWFRVFVIFASFVFSFIL